MTHKKKYVLNLYELLKENKGKEKKKLLKIVHFDLLSSTVCFVCIGLDVNWMKRLNVDSFGCEYHWEISGKLQMRCICKYRTLPLAVQKSIHAKNNHS